MKLKLLQGSRWVVCTGMHLDYRDILQCKALVSAGLTTMHCSLHCSAKKRLVLLYSAAMWHHWLFPSAVLVYVFFLFQHLNGMAFYLPAGQW